MLLGKYIQQAGGFKAFVPTDFPPNGLLDFSPEILAKAALAERLTGKLDGISQTLPDAGFFLFMYVAKDATYSSQIEGTKATLVDALELDAGVQSKKTDADDILFYIRALNYGMKRLKKFPLSLRFVRELHKELMMGARSSQFAAPGEFRRSQNWIGGTTPANADFVPPPVNAINKALNEWEKFVHQQKVVPVLQAGLLHAQFETIHPFLDGNGRTGRLLITLFMYEREVLEQPVLFLSSYFKKHQQLYYKRLNDYHNGNTEPWLHFFLDGIIETAKESIDVSGKINKLREKDMEKIQALGKREAASGVLLLQQLFKTPVVTAGTVAAHTGFSRLGAQKVIDRFIAMEILKLKDETVKYGKTYIYYKYVSIFEK